VTVSESALPAETSVGRVALDVADLDRLVEFYDRVVGLAVHHHDSESATLGAGGTGLLELHAAPDMPPREGSDAGLFHTAFRVPSRAALGEALDRIESQWRLTGASDHHVSEALYLDDPEDNGVEIYCDRPREEWPTRDGRVQMDTLALDLDSLREATNDSPTGDPEGLPPDSDVGHVHLEATDIAAARRFYVDTLGLGIRQEWTGALFVAAGAYHHHVGLNTWNGRSTPASGRGLAWFELKIPGEQALGAARDRLLEGGYDVRETDDGLAVSDSDGIGLRLNPV